MPNHPLLVWRFQNTSGVALEQGPITVSEAGRYRGEGLMRFAGVGDEIQIAYALEFGILVQQDAETQPRRLWSATFDSASRVAQVGYAHVTEHRYTHTSHVSRDIAVQIEHRDPQRGAYVEMPEPALAQGGHTRWEVVVPAEEASTFTVREREIQTSEVDITSWRADDIAELRGAGLLDDRVSALLQQLLDIAQQAADAAEQRAAIEAEYQQMVGRQEQLRKNLSALGSSEREVAIRNRILDDLEASEDRRRAIESALIELERQAKQQQATQQSLVDAIYAAEA
jgi:hypothetical protein